jgi:hypothetical protein
VHTVVVSSLAGGADFVLAEGGVPGYEPEGPVEALRWSEELFASEQGLKKLVDFLAEDDAKRGRGGKTELLARADEAPLDYLVDTERPVAAVLYELRNFAVPALVLARILPGVLKHMKPLIADLKTVMEQQYDNDTQRDYGNFKFWEKNPGLSAEMLFLLCRLFDFDEDEQLPADLDRFARLLQNEALPPDPKSPMPNYESVVVGRCGDVLRALTEEQKAFFEEREPLPGEAPALRDLTAPPDNLLFSVIKVNDLFTVVDLVGAGHSG